MQKLTTIAEQALEDSQDIYLVGVGTWPVGQLKKNVKSKLDDLKRRIDSAELDGVGDGQLEMLCHMILTLKAALEGHDQGPNRTRLQIEQGSPNKTPSQSAPSNVVPFRK